MTTSLPVRFHNGTARVLSRIALQTSSTSTDSDWTYSERWLQELIQECPEVLPTFELEPGFGRLIPIALEVPCGHGFIDNLFVTAEGGIAIVETKLWRNPEARRSVVAQTLDYASALSRMTYPELEKAALQGVFPGGSPTPPSIYSVVRGHADALSEEAFIDAVASNLKRGRMLVIAAGDGIRSEAETLAGLLQSHAGARFTFALVAIELFRDELGGVLAVPRTIAKTALIERGVVRVIGDNIAVEDAPQASSRSAPARTTMTEEMFMEEIAKRDPALPSHLGDFLVRARELGVEPDWKASLNLKWRGWADGPEVNLGYIRKDGGLSTDATTWRTGAELSREYQETLAQLSGGRVMIGKSETIGPYLAASDGKSTVKIDTLIPSHSQAWLDAISRLIDKLRQVAPE